MTAPTFGPYSPVVQAGEWLVVSGQLGTRDGKLVEGGVPAQLTQAIANLASVLNGAGAELCAVVKTTVFLTDIGEFAAMNSAYSAAFADHRPARSCVGVAGLPLGAAVEVEAWAYQPHRGAT